MSIRIKLILFINALISIVGILSCLFFFMHSKKQHEEALKKLGISLAIVLAQDDKVKHALKYTQPSFPDALLKKIRALDTDDEIGYLRVSNSEGIMITEERPSEIAIDTKTIPAVKDYQNTDVLFTYRINIIPGNDFYDFSTPVFESQAFPEEVFARQILSEDTVSLETEQKPLGYVQIGLSTHRLTERIHKVIFYSIIPMGLSIIFCGVCTTFFLARYIISPLQHLAYTTLDVAKGKLTHTANVNTKDEIGQLSMYFNQMTKALAESYSDLRQEVEKHKRTTELLHYRVKLEELIAVISTSFINLAPSEVDTGIHYALEMIGSFVDVDRSYVFLYSDSNEKTMDNTHEWCAEGIESQMKNLKGISVDQFPWGMEKLKRFEVVHVPSVSSMPEYARAERELQRSQSVLSFIVVPMIYGGSLVGFLGFDSVRVEKTWTEQDITLLKVVGEIFANALEHRRKEEMLQKAYDKLEIRVMERTLELLKTNNLLKEEISEHKKAKRELKKYEILISQMTDLSYICDAKGNIVFVNHMFEKLTGHKSGEFVGKSFASLFDEENLKKAMDVYARTLRGESPQYELYFKDTGILCEYKNLPLKDEGGNITGVTGIARDVTGRRQIEDMLRKTNQTLHALILASPVAIIVLDSHGRIRMWNPSAEHIFGWTERELLNQPIPSALKGKQEEFRMLRNWILRGESFMGLELRRKRRDGSPIDISVSTAPLHDSRGNITGIVGIITDVTERKRMVDELRQAKDYAENLIETANVMVVGLDTTGSIRVFNKAAEKITGYEKNEIIGKDWFETIVPKDKFYYVWEEFMKLYSGGQVLKTFENPILTKTGQRRYISWQNSEVSERGKVSGVISFGIDITEQKQAKALVERLRIMSFVKDVGVAITQGDDLPEILRQCAEAVVHNLDAVFARIWILNEKENMLELRASAGMYTHITGFHSRIPVGEFKIGRIALERRPYLTNSIIDDPYISDRDWVKKEGIVSFAGYPLIVKDHLVGVIGMFARKMLPEYISRALASAADIIALGVDRKQAEEALRMSESKYRLLLENLPQRIFYKDKNFVYVSCNENYARDLGIRPDDIRGKTDYDFYPEIIAERYMADDIRIMKLGKPEDMEEKHIKDGQEFIIHTIRTPVKDEEGNVIGILGIFWDVTEKVTLGREAIRNKHLAALGELAAGVAHEINNPIMGVINCAQILYDKNSDDGKERDIASRIIKEGKRIANIVSSLLSFARPGDKKEKKSNTSIQEIMTETLILTEAQLRKEGIQIQLNIPQNIPGIYVHPQQIQQVFLNLISNARYALNQKYPGVHENKILEIFSEEVIIDSCPYIKISFCDHGTGIPSNIVDKIMDPFFTIKPRGKGTGLGLSISHGIVTEHGGKILITSVEGEFTRITVIFPTVQNFCG
ncbi:MAG: PAS domain S-box protein [wastewater metagenome]|nr:PAS domain S-box protein [Candidatus Loosdrechtia aerotolerans]